MTASDLQKAELALFAARAAGKGASLEQMKGICYCIRNRFRLGWFDNWLAVMEHAHEAAGNLPGEPFCLDLNVRAFQRLVSDVDDIYYGGRTDATRFRHDKAPTAQSFATESFDLEGSLERACYWYFADRPISPWFRQHILGRPEEHPMRAQMGLMMFFE